MTILPVRRWVERSRLCFEETYISMHKINRVNWCRIEVLLHRYSTEMKNKRYAIWNQQQIPLVSSEFLLVVGRLTSYFPEDGATKTETLSRNLVRATKQLGGRVLPERELFSWPSCSCPWSTIFWRRTRRTLWLW